MADFQNLGLGFDNYADFLKFHFPKGGVPLGWNTSDPVTNVHAYSCEPFDKQAALKVLCIGDSWTEAHYCARSAAYPGVLCGLLAQHFGVTVADWNMGMGEGSYDSICRTLLCAVGALAPDLVVIALPTLARREFYRSNGRRIRLDYTTADAVRGGTVQPAPPGDTRYYYEEWVQLDSHLDDSVNAVKNLKLMERVLNDRGVIWGYGVDVCFDWVQLTGALRDKGWIDRAHYLGFDFEAIDTVSKDDSHPGLASHRLFGERLFAWARDKHGDALAARIRSAAGKAA